MDWVVDDPGRPKDCPAFISIKVVRVLFFSFHFFHMYRCEIGQEMDSVMSPGRSLIFCMLYGAKLRCAKARN